MTKLVKKLKAFQLIDRIPVRLRLSLGHAIWMALILVCVGVGVSRFIEENIYDSLDATLITSAKTMREEGRSGQFDSLRLRNSPFWWSVWDEFAEGRRLAVRSYPKMVDLSGNISARSSNMSVRLPVTPYTLARAEKGLATFETFPQRGGVLPQLRQVTLPVMSQGHFTGELIQVGAALEPTHRMIRQMKIMLLISLSSALVISVFLGYLLTKAAFKPVTRITATAKGLSANDLDKRITLTSADDELRTLIVTFNQMLDRLEDAFARLRRFAGDVSHELRTPLAVLRGEAELALRRDRTKDEYKKALSVIADESKSMSKIVEDLLLLARAQGKSIDLKWQEIGLEVFIEEIVRDVRKNFEDKGVSLNLNIFGNRPIRVGATYLSLAIKNLLLNALKHSQPGKTVEFEVAPVGDELVFSIKDQGEGIDERDLPYLFDAFYRADTARNRKLGGFGIGLSLAQALVKLHGGRIGVESKLGEGSVFRIFIPETKSIDNGNGKLSSSQRSKILSTLAFLAPKPRPVIALKE